MQKVFNHGPWQVVLGGTYQHSQGGIFRVICVCRDASKAAEDERARINVIYRSVVNSVVLWSMPIEEFRQHFELINPDRKDNKI